VFCRIEEASLQEQYPKKSNPAGAASDEQTGIQGTVRHRANQASAAMGESLRGMARRRGKQNSSSLVQARIRKSAVRQGRVELHEGRAKTARGAYSEGGSERNQGISLVPPDSFDAAFNLRRIRLVLNIPFSGRTPHWSE
jgi:hypothetical protein